MDAKSDYHRMISIVFCIRFGQFFLLSGAVGNLIDRALYGYVIDFIDLHVNSFYWPVFNFADSFIFIGVALILFERKSSAK